MQQRRDACPQDGLHRTTQRQSGQTTAPVIRQRIPSVWSISGNITDNMLSYDIITLLGNITGNMLSYDIISGNITDNMLSYLARLALYGVSACALLPAILIFHLYR